MNDNLGSDTNMFENALTRHIVNGMKFAETHLSWLGHWGSWKRIGSCIDQIPHRDSWLVQIQNVLIRTATEVGM